MGRKSLLEERREAILAAFERCIGRDGIDVPLERIAEEAGMQRSLIRHYLGNRDELVNQVIARIVDAYPRRVATMLEPAKARGRDGLLDLFFASEILALEWDDVIQAVSNTVQGRYPEAKRQVAAMVATIVAQLAETLQQLYPQASAPACLEAAYGVVCLAQANAELSWLGLDQSYHELARASAGRLLDRLG